MDGAGTMKIIYTIDGGRRPAPAHERLEISDDGAFTMWRSLSTMSTPPSAVGRFAGSVPADALRQIQQAASEASGAGDLAQPVPPDGAVQVVQLDGATARVGAHAEATGAWGTLLGLLRELLGTLADQPLAVVAVEVAKDASRASLRHLGTVPLVLELAGAVVRVVVWRDGAKAGDWRSGPIGDAKVEASAGWSLELPFDHSLALHAGDKTDVYVTFGADDGGHAVRAQLLHRVE